MQSSQAAILEVVVVAAVVLATVTGGAGTVVAQEQYTDFSEPTLDTSIRGQNVVEPGEERTFEVAVQNRHSGTTNTDRRIDEIAQVVQTHRINLGAASGVTADVASGDAPVDVRTGTQSLGTIDAGNGRQASLTVEVDEDASPGTYRLPVTMTYSYIFGIYVDRDDYIVNRNTETVTTAVTVRVEPESRLAVLSTAGDDLYKGADGTVTATVRNSGSETARDASLVMQSSEYLQPRSNQVSLGDLGPDETATASFQVGVSDIDADGTYTANFQLHYEDGNGDAQTSAVRTGNVTIADNPSYSLTAESNALYVDSLGAANVTITNTGNRTVPDARARLEPLDPFTLVSSTVSLGTLEPGESATGQFKLEVSDQAIAQNYPLSVTVVHDDRYGNHVESDPQTVDVAVGPESRIRVVDAARISAGSTDTVELTIENAGSETFTDAVARINANTPFETDDDTAYVGTLDPGERTTVSYTLSVDGAATPKSYTLDTTIKYDNALGETVVTDVEPAPIEVVEESGMLPLSLPGIAIVLVVLLLVAGGALLYRRGTFGRFQ